MGFDRSVVCRPRPWGSGLARDTFQVRRKPPAGFTLVELLVVITIISILVGLMLPAVQAARETARRTSCGNNLHQIGVGLLAYHEANGRFPVGCVDRWGGGRRGKMIAWSVYLLPYLEQDPVFTQFNFDARYNAAENSQATSHVVPTYLCPSTGRREKTRLGDVTTGAGGALAGCTDYAGCFGFLFPDGEQENGVLIWDRALAMIDIHDGTSNTLAVAEDTGRGWAMDGEWANGENIFQQSGPINANQNNEMWSDHPRGVHGLFCDGSVRFLRDAMDVATVTAICTRERNDHVDILQLP
jgi:prepilin-type N-terminal cleavage/methylation domain-containing protein/prepilin-type processing-associated H-X9-DG protein